MSDPNLPEGVKQSDIDKTVGETFDPDLCEHDAMYCENCGDSMSKDWRRLKLLRKDDGIWLEVIGKTKKCLINLTLATPQYSFARSALSEAWALQEGEEVR